MNTPTYFEFLYFRVYVSKFKENEPKFTYLQCCGILINAYKRILLLLKTLFRILTILTQYPVDSQLMESVDKHHSAGGLLRRSNADV